MTKPKPKKKPYTGRDLLAMQEFLCNKGGPHRNHKKYHRRAQKAAAKKEFYG